MNFTNRTKYSTSFENRSDASRVREVGDMSEDDFFALLGSSPTFETIIPGVVGGDKAFGELTFEDRILISIASLWSLPSRLASAWTNRALE